MLMSDEREAMLRYDTPEYHVIRPGDFVICAVTQQRIPLAELKYWSVERQEPYANASASLEAELRGNKPRS